MSGIRENRESLSAHSKAFLVLLPFFGIAISAQASAQVISASEDSNTVIEVSGDQFDISGGQLSSDDANLFHNFEQFGLSSGQIANFETIPNVQNVVGNVSGGQASTINGMLQVSGSDASLYLMNPAGILIGPDSQLNLSGGFTATTATGLGFEDGQFDANTSNYGQLTGAPTTFLFENQQAGAVVNTGDLSVDDDNSINLIGGTVVNTGSLSAPEGAIRIVAVEGESRVRISQDNQILSLEVETAEPSQTAPQITAQSIGSMLTGSGLSNATALVVEPDGTVRLGSAVVEESGGGAIAVGTIRTAGGNVAIRGTDVSVENIDTSIQASTKDNPDLAAGSILIRSAQDVVTGNLRAFGLHEQGGGRSPHGGQVSVQADNGSITTGDIFSYSDGDRNNSGNGGRVGLTAAEKITTQAINSSSQVTVSNSILKTADSAGTINISSGNGIAINGNIDASSQAVDNIANVGGDIYLSTDFNSITVTGDILSRSSGKKGSSLAGFISIDAPTIKVSGLDSSSRTAGSPSGLSSRIQIMGDVIDFGNGSDSVVGSNVFIDPKTPSRQVSIGLQNDLALSITEEEIASIDSNVGSLYVGQLGDNSVGDIQLDVSVTSASAASRVPIRIQDGKTLIGADEDTIYNVTGKGTGSIVGSGDALTTFSGISAIQGGVGDDEFRVSPSILDTEFGALNGGDGNNILNYTQLDYDITLSVEGLANLKVKGATALGRSNTLVGIDSDSYWRVSGSNSGYAIGSDGGIEFEGFGNIIGGSGQDTFFFESTGALDGKIAGGGNEDTLSYALFDSAIAVDLETGRSTATAFSEIENFVGSGIGGSTISGANRGSRWEIAGNNSGSVDNATFSNFYELLGKGGDDTFFFYDSGQIAGIIEGGGGDDSLDYSNYKGTVELSLTDSSFYNSLNHFRLIETVVGNGSASILGGDRNTDWKIGEIDSGYVEGLSFSGFNRLVGGIEDDSFNFIGDGKVTGYVIGGLGRGLDALNYKNHTSAVEIYPDRVLDEEGSVITNKFAEIENVFGDEYTSFLHGYDTRSRFEVQTNGSVKLGDLVAIDIAGVSGSGENALLDYSTIDRAIAVDLENSKIHDGLSLSFENIKRIVADGGYKNSLVGTNGDDLFEVVGSRQIEADGLLFSNFSSVDGGEGTNQFIINGELASNISIDGGNDTLSSQNLISSKVAGANWRLSSGKNTGRLEGPTGTVLAEFSQVQKLENSTTDSTHSLIFTSSDSQLTGGINSRDSDLVLIGDDINIGHGDENNNIVGAEIAGNRTLKILSESAGVDIELGGSDGEGAALNITNGEVAAIRDGFSNVVIGDDTLTRRLTLKDDVRIESALALRSSSEVDGESYQLAADGILIESDRIAIGTLYSRDRVLLTAQNDIAVKAISAGGLGVELLSATGGISVEGGVATSSGGVSLNAQDSIAVGFIDATGQETSSAGFIQIETDEDFTASAYIPGASLSLSTGGTDSGSIDIRYGNSSRPEKAFLVGQESRNGTVGGIRAALEIVSGDVPSGTSQGGITIIDRGYQLAEPRTPVVPLKIVEPFPEQSLSSEISIVEGELEGSKEILRSLETEMNQGFETYLNLHGESTKRLVTPLKDIQQTLQKVEETTDTKASLVYVYFVPDAAFERSVASQGDEVAAPDDQLEVMLINAEGEPMRKRQWGITRAQVEAASLELRQQITSQFTTASQYLKPAQQLYGWIMSPIVKALEEEQVESIGFVMDTGLRTMPLAALHDGDRYLVENYSLGLLPTFSLTDFRTDNDVDIDLKEARVLAMGASQFEEQPNLPAVDAEIELITQELWEGDAFVNEDFVLKNLQTQIENQDYGVVHLATHASFESGNLEQSYIQLWDEKLALDDVDELGLDRSNVSLIILSACNTALGDRASEYGFAGFAVASGSQSALASLWPVNDEGTLGFMSQFYSELKQAPVRADALRQAQISLIRGEVGIDSGVVYDAVGDEVAVLPSLAESGRWDFSHPFFWSAFTMIGNPW